MNRNVITVVSGLPRSGTSLMMSMLEAAGIEPLQDDVRKPDVDNPKGYYELERVKKLESDHEWLADAKGRSIKIVSRLITALRPGLQYKVIWMQRDFEEIVSSQLAMLQRPGNFNPNIPENKIRSMLRQHVDKTLTWLDNQDYIDRVFIDYNQLIISPEGEVTRLASFLGGVDAKQMIRCIDPVLYRNRRLS